LHRGDSTRLRDRFPVRSTRQGENHASIPRTAASDRRRRNCWRITPHGAIRDKDGRCPICALVKEIDPNIDYSQIYDTALFRLARTNSFRDADLIVSAADNAGHPCRKELMQLLGMEVEGLEAF